MKEKIKTNDNADIEEEIVRIIQKKTQGRQIPVVELEKMISEEIEKVNYFSEDWQKHYAKERIKENLRPKKKTSRLEGTLEIIISLIPALFLYSITKAILQEAGIILGGPGGMLLLIICWSPFYLLTKRKRIKKFLLWFGLIFSAFISVIFFIGIVMSTINGEVQTDFFVFELLMLLLFGWIAIMIQKRLNIPALFKKRKEVSEKTKESKEIK